MEGTRDPVRSEYGSKGYRSFALGALTLVYVFNFIDRTIINILTEPIKASFQLEDWQMGLLGGPAFAILYTFLGIPIARLSDRYNRVVIISMAVIAWSVMTVLCGFAVSFLILLMFRVGVSIGEAGCTPPAQSLIADYFHPSKRATAISIYALGVPLGSMMAAVFGGFVAGNLSGSDLASLFQSLGWFWAQNVIDWSQVEGWRIAFIIVGAPGILVGFLVLIWLREPPRGYTDPPHLQTKTPSSFIDTFRVLRNKPAFVHVVCGATVTAFVGYGIGQFITSFLIRTHGLDLQSAALLFGVLLGVMSSIGVFASGYISDRVAVRFPTALTWIPAIGMAGAVPLFLIGYSIDKLAIAIAPLMIASIANSLYVGPSFAVASGVVDSRMRATSVAITLFVINLIGYGLGPLVIGALSSFLKASILANAALTIDLATCQETVSASDQVADICAHADRSGLQWSILIFVCLYAWAAVHFARAGRTLVSDLVAGRGE